MVLSQATSTAAGREMVMAETIEQKLAALGIVLPTPTVPRANYVPFVRTGNILTVSGQICHDSNGQIVATGKLGADVSVEVGQAAARACAVCIIAQLKAALGDLDRIVQLLRLNGFVSAAPGFADHPKVINGASDLMVEILGDKGRHTRITVGCSSLPLNAAVEIDAVFAID